MSSLLGQRLSTKLFLPPARRNLVPRPHLIEQLDDGLKGKLTIVSAPAGFGKTSLVTAWRQRDRMPIAWFSLDEEDNEPEVFADYLVGALQTIDGCLGRDSAVLLQNAPAPPLKVFLTSLLNEISECETEFTLALDDYHVITNFVIHDAMSYLIERLPPRAHILLISRTDPPFPLSRLRAGGDLKELRAAHLRFAQSEASAFLNDVMKLDLSDGDVATLEQKTEGWVTGLQFCGLSLQGKQDKSEFVQQFAGDERFILDYLLEEVLNRQPEKVQDFLLQTSVLHRLTGPLCNALTESSDAHEMLEHLSRSNLFLIPLDNKNHWFRYHHLFGDLLRFKLQQKNAGRGVEMLLRASKWCEENDLLEEAIGYSLAAKDWDRAVKLIEPTAYKLISVARFERVKHWAESIPAAALAKHPLVCYWYVPTLLYSEEFDKAEEYLQHIENTEPLEIRERLMSAVWSSRCYIAIARAELENAIAYSEKATELMTPEDPVGGGVATHARLSTSLLLGDAKETEALALEALPVYAGVKHYTFEVWGMTWLGFGRAQQGHLSAALEQLRNTIRYAKENVPMRPDPQVYPHSFLADIYRERDDLENARIHVDEAITLIETTGRESFIVLVAENLKALALTLDAIGDRQLCDRMIESGLERLKKYGNEVFARELRAVRALIALRRGDSAFVDQWAASSGLSADDEIDYSNEISHMTFARWMISTGKLDDSIRLLENLQRDATAKSRYRTLIEILVIQALACSANGDEARAQDLLEQALVRAEPESYVRTFTDEGDALAKLLVQALQLKGRRWETERPALLRYVIRLNDAFGRSSLTLKPQKPNVDTDALPWWYVNDPLSEREIEVMQLVAQGLSNQEIGSKIFISAGTVKRHLSNIYQKLNVHSRIQAIELARKFQLISTAGH